MEATSTLTNILSARAMSAKLIGTQGGQLQLPFRMSFHPTSSHAHVRIANMSNVLSVPIHTTSFVPCMTLFTKDLEASQMAPMSCIRVRFGRNTTCKAAE
ncbi:hypothetical protein WJX77_012517 [Trebouxia sp. C0004]